MQVREATSADLGAVLELYSHLHGEAPPPPSEELDALWAHIMGDPDRHIILVELERVIAASCEVIILPNLTHGQRSYALVENMVTRPDLRRRGCGGAALAHAVILARRAGCYKIMLMSSEKHEDAAGLYQSAGFVRGEKTAYVQWLDES
uniref:Putative GCN5related Nacetyltransferase n=1 Tax=termite gut metagenome TaxID=433724 RepID=S0DFH3_9ZZZZ